MRRERRIPTKGRVSGSILSEIQDQLSKDEATSPISSNRPVKEKRPNSNYRSIYRSNYYHSGLDVDQQSQEFWEDIL